MLRSFRLLRLLLWLRCRFFSGLFLRLPDFLFRRCFVLLLLLRGRYLVCRNGRSNLSGFRFRCFGFRSNHDHSAHIGTAGFVGAFRQRVDAPSFKTDAVGGDPFPDKVIAHGAGTAQRQPFVRGLRACLVRPPGNADSRDGIRQSPAKQATCFFILRSFDPLAVAGREIKRRAHHDRIAFSRTGNDIPALRLYYGWR